MKKDNLIFIHRLIKAFSDSIIIVFIPLYILKQTNDINLAMLYLITYSLFVIFLMFILKKFIQKYGVIAIMLHFIPIIIGEAILSFVPISIISIICVSFFLALNQALYSIPLNLIFTFGDKNKNVGKFQIATNIGKLIFTLISGIILSSEIKNSFLILSITSAIFYIFCVFPLFFAYKELKDKYNCVKNNSKNFTNKINPWFTIFHISFGLFQPIMDNIVPLFLYINNLSFQAVTYMIVLVEFLKIVINYISQWLVIHKLEKLCVTIGFLVFMVSLVGMVTIKNSIILYILCCTCSISFPLTFVPMFKIYCNYLCENNMEFHGITVRDFDIFSLRGALYGVSFLPIGIVSCFVVGFFAVPVMFISELKILSKK